MALRCRIRHKLLLGLGLVVGIIGLLLGGTVYGLVKFRATVKSIDSKQAELKAAEDLRDRVSSVQTTAADRAGGPGELTRLRGQLTLAEDELNNYERQLQATLERNRDPGRGKRELLNIDALRDAFRLLHAAVTDASAPSAEGPASSEPLSKQYPTTLGKQIGVLVATGADLCEAIRTDLADRSRDAQRTFRSTMWVVCTTSVGGVVLLASLLRSFYGWVFFPIRDLRLGARRVAEGDFEHRIEVHSGDELEELAAAFNDMTDRLREMYRDLARQVNERSRQLVRSERLASVGFLAAGVAHEINNPLASIAFCSEALVARTDGLLNRAPGEAATISKYLKMIQEEAFRCKAITQRLLEFSRGGERRREPTDLVEVVRAVLDMAQLLQNCKGKQIVFDPPGRLVAWVNGQEIKSVVLNLVVNALDSMDDGGTLTIALAQRGRTAVLTFHDTGCGMSQDILENIFEPFFTRSRTGKGTGLGLSISHRIVSQHGGEIEAASPGPNRGSTFTVRLPLEPAELSKEESFGHLAA